LGKVTKSIEIEASPEKVFTWLLDINNMNDASKGMIEYKSTSTGPLALGSTMHFVGIAGGQTQETDMEVTEFVKDKKLAFRSVGGSKTKMALSLELEPAAKVTKLTSASEYEVPYSIVGKLVDKLKIQKDIEKNTAKILEYIKKAIET
jgi:hypothetical protein